MSVRDVDAEMRQVLSSVTLTTTPLGAPPEATLGELGVDSVGMIDLVYRIEEQFNVEIGDADVTPESFASIRSLVDLVRRKCVA